MHSHLLSESELIEYAKGESLIDRLRGLHDQQKDTWSLAAENYENLKKVITKDVIIDDILSKLQFNPERVRSTTADVDTLKPKEKCILCEDNLPQEQKFLRYYKEYNFLINPYPIFQEHFTVVKNKHVPQSISSYLNDLLLIARDVGERYAVFYNGPKCGASIPDHLHFQMGNKSTFPILDQLKNLRNTKSILSIRRKKITVTSIELTKRQIVIVESNDSIEILNCFSVILNNLRGIDPKLEEPMMNLLCVYEDKKWKVVLFLRQKHRPVFYYKEGRKQIIVSPAAVDMSGLIILPREEDLEKLNAENILEMFREVSFSKEYMEYLNSKLKSFYA